MNIKQSIINGVDTLELNFNNSLNLRTNLNISENEKKFIKIFLEQDYMLTMHVNGTYYFRKRKDVIEYYKNQNHNLPYRVYNDLIYYIDNYEEINSIEKILVIFSGCKGDIDISNPINRYLVFNFPNIKKYIKPDTLVVRIADFNLMSGSFYRNTTNFPDFEEQIESFINLLIEKYKITKSDVLFWGPSKGGSGAIFHGSKLDINFIASDPVCNLKVSKRDKYYILPKKIINPEIISTTDIVNISGNTMKYIITSENVPEQYEVINKIFTNTNIKIYNLKNPKIKTHPHVIEKSIHLTLALINTVLEEDSIDDK